MKRCLCLVLAICMMVAACGTASNVQNSENSCVKYDMGVDELLSTNAFYYGDLGVNLFSTATKEHSLLCYHSTCGHTSKEGCFASEVIIGSIRTYQQHFVYLTAVDWNQFYLCQSSMTGDNREKLVEIPKMQRFLRMTYCEQSDIAYMAFMVEYAENEIDGPGEQLERPEIVIFEVDAKNRTVKELLRVAETNPLLNAFYIYNNHLYAQINYLDEPMDYSDEEHMPSEKDVYEHSYTTVYAYDIKNETLDECYHEHSKAVGFSVDDRFFYVEHNEMIEGEDHALHVLAYENKDLVSLETMTDVYFVDSIQDAYVFARNDAEKGSSIYELIDKDTFEIKQTVAYSIQDVLPVAYFEDGVYYHTQYGTENAWISSDSFWGGNLAEHVVYR